MENLFQFIEFVSWTLLALGADIVNIQNKTVQKMI